GAARRRLATRLTRFGPSQGRRVPARPAALPPSARRGSRSVDRRERDARALRRRVRCHAGRAPRTPVDIRSRADGRDTGGRSAATAVPLLEPRAALARPAGVLASLGGGDPGRDAP